MTEREIKIAIAEFDGLSERLKLETQWEKGSVYFSSSIPNYPHDLNAIHEVEKKLTDEQKSSYQRRLEVLVCPSRSLYCYQWTWHATAHQRCEALLRTIGKWKD